MFLEKIPVKSATFLLFPIVVRAMTFYDVVVASKIIRLRPVGGVYNAIQFPLWQTYTLFDIPLKYQLFRMILAIARRPHGACKDKSRIVPIAFRNI